MTAVPIERIAKVFRPDHSFLRGLPDDNLLINPLLDITEDEREKDELTEFYKLCNPFYSPVFGAKYLLGAKLFPFQMSTMLALLRHKFPLLLLTRGGGKTYILACYALYHAIMFPYSRIILVSASFRQSKLIFQEMERMVRAWPLLRQIMDRDPVHTQDSWKMEICGSTITALPMGDGCLVGDTMVTYGDGVGTLSEDQPEDVPGEQNVVVRERMVWGAEGMSPSDESYYNRYTDTIRLRTSRGFEIEGTHNHKIKIVRDGNVIWERLDNIRRSDHVLIDRSDRWHHASNDISEAEAYAIGLLVGDGSFKDPYKVGFATKDPELANAVRAVGDFVPAGDGHHYNSYGKDAKNELMSRFGISYRNIDTDKKVVPEHILGASKDVVTAFLAGLMDSDGGVVDVGSGSTCVEFNNTSKRLVSQVQYLLLHYGIVSTVYERDRHASWNRCYQLTIRGENMKRFHRSLGFRLERKRESLDRVMREKRRFVNQSDYVPDVIHELIQFSETNRATRGSMDTRRCSHSYLKNRSNASWDMASDFLRVYGHMDDPVVDKLRGLYDPTIFYDRVSVVEHGRMAHTYDIHVPGSHEYCANGFFSHNSKIRGERGHVIIADEFDSIDIETFNVVVRGFAATQLDPWEKVKARLIGDTDEDRHLEDVNSGNKIILAGTAGFVGGTLHSIYSDYAKIIAHNVDGALGDYSEVFEGDNRKDLKVNCRNYCILTYKYDELPLMEREIVEANRAQMPRQLFDMEYNATFADDSQGFFKAKYIRSATSQPPNGFSVLKVGKPKCSYVMGVDPAKVLDRFAITLIELGTPHKIVYQWTAQGDKYSDCAAHMRELSRRFNVVGIAMDAGGGGLSIEEMVNMEKTDDGKRIRKPEEPKWVRFDDDSKESRDDGIPMVHLQNFGSNWLDDANTLLQKNIEDKITMFPMTTSDSALDDEAEDILYEIAEMKKELIAIGITYTKTGRKSFDLKPPGPKEEGVKHKDRYSALLLANFMASRLDDIQYDEQEFLRRKYQDDDTMGGWAEDF